VIQFEQMTISEIVLWLEQRQGEVRPSDLRKLRQDVRVGVRRAVEQWDRRRRQVLTEQERLHWLWTEERKLWQAGYRMVAGVDEAGRGPLAGPVVAAAVIFPGEVHIEGMNDSKQLTAATREELFIGIVEQASAVSVAASDHQTIDRDNILQATKQAMQLAVRGLGTPADYVLVDGNSLPAWRLPSQALIKGDSRSFSIAAASIVAKVMRDRMMVEYDRIFPGYGFASHKGYPCPEHYRALMRHGPCSIHRITFLRKFAAGLSDDE
jgi:ribonuclease HII